ncbi:MAG: hypothetical protein RL616_506 [Verrucomicrobiota bacterium]|jgi:hypothetical protein
MNTYQHTQKGTAIVVAMLVMAGTFFILGICLFKQFFISVPILLVIAWLFHSLTIEIAGGELRWKFGPGFISNRVLLTEIAAAVPARNRFSWGLHWHPSTGWLYNVSGFDAVTVTMRGGKKFMLGTDEPAALAEAIRSHIR